MKPRPRTPALWVLRHRRRPSTTADPVAAERRRTYAAMDPGERLARALALSSFALGLRESARRSRLKLMAGGPGDMADVADLLERAGPLPELEKRATARGVLAHRSKRRLKSRSGRAFSVKLV